MERTSVTRTSRRLNISTIASRSLCDPSIRLALVRQRTLHAGTTLRTLTIDYIYSIGGKPAMQDLEYKGYKIPKGYKVGVTMYFVNRDPTLFPQPEAFLPERWEKDSPLMA